MRRSVPPFTLLLFLVGGIVALFGTYWDDAWHTDRGRDSFTIPPHLLLYGGVLVIGAATVWWAAMRFRQEKRIRPVISHPPLLLNKAVKPVRETLYNDRENPETKRCSHSQAE